MKRRTGRQLASAIVGLLLLAAGLPGTAAAVDISLPGGEQQPLPTMPPCHESKKVLCTSPADSAQAATGLAQLTSDPKVRRGLGLPPLRKLFGKHGGAKLRQADSRFAKQAGEPLSAATSAARASAGDSLGQSLGADQVLHNGDTKQTRTLRIEVEVDQCPPPGRSPTPTATRISSAGPTTSSPPPPTAATTWSPTSSPSNCASAPAPW